MIPYGRQDINEADIESVVQVLRSDFLTQGPAVPAFEREVANSVGAANAVAVNSATSALHLACLALDVGPGDIVWTSPVTFVASANCALYCGATVDFVDIHPQTWNLSVERLAEKLEEAEKSGRLPKVVIPVHLSGQSCDMEAIGRLGRRYGFRIIEDASHAIGGTYQGERVGCCRHSDISIFSFHPVKIITTGEGGMVLTNDTVLAERMARLRTHGITRELNAMTRTPDGPWYYEQLELGFNYRMCDIQAALGLSQMKRLRHFVECRTTLADRYDSLLRHLPVQLPARQEASASAWHLYIIRMRKDLCKAGHGETFSALRSAGIGVNLHYIPVYLQPYYQSLGFPAGYCPEAELYYREAISLPLYSSLTESQQDQVVATLTEVLT